MKWIRSFSILGAFLAAPAFVSAQSMAGGSLQAAQAGFGGAIAIAEGDVLVGEGRNQTRPGMVYVYRNTGTGWTEVAQLTGPNAEDGDGFGRAMATDGSTVLIAENGAVSVFEKQGDTWTEVGAMMSEAAGFGASLAISGDWALVGAPQHGESNQGGVMVYRRSGSDWSEAGQIMLDDAAENDFFGSAVGLEGGRALISATGRDNRTGAVFAYAYDAASGGFVAAGELSAQGLGPRESFGGAITMADGRAFVGAPGHAGQIGGVFVFRPNDDGDWVQVQRLLPYDGRRRGGFGGAIAVTDDQIWVGASGASAIYAFDFDEDGVRGVERMTGPEIRRSGFGAAFAISEDVVAFGMPGADFGQGRAAIYETGGTMGMMDDVTIVFSEEEGLEAVAGEEVRCSDEGGAAHFTCTDVDLVSFMPVKDLGGDRGISTNDVWGWTDPDTGKEYALVGMTNQASFVDISNATSPVLVGTLPMTETAQPSTWRDIKVYMDHAYIVADGAAQHGIQVFDLTRLREFDGEPMEFTVDALYDEIASAHNIVINEESGFAYAVGVNSGGETCGGGLHMVDITSPKSPTFAGCFADPLTGRRGTGYTHDAQCVNYTGPDEDYADREICFSANETALSIGDVTDKSATVAISRGTYPNPGYTHQGWLTEDMRYFYINDELDEIQGTTDRTRTMIFDVSDLDDPQLVDFFFGTEGSSDHNLYVVGDRMYQSNYQGGLRVVDISDPESPEEIAFFDTVPYGTNTPGFGGSWSNYPFFASGVIIVTSGREGLFVVRSRDSRPISD